MKIGICDPRIGNDTIKILEKENIKLIYLPCLPQGKVYEGLRGHADIMICQLDKNSMVVAPEVYNFIKEQCFEILKYQGISTSTLNIIKGEKTLEKIYPSDISYNLACLGSYAIHNFNYTDPRLVKEIEKRKLIKIHVNQAYSKCSLACIDDKSIITSDFGIYKQIKDTDISCLLIEPGHIILKDMNTGFIGGSGGVLSANRYLFCGNIKKHPDYKKIKSFFDERNIDLVFSEKEELEDFGTVMVFEV